MSDASGRLAMVIGVCFERLGTAVALDLAGRFARRLAFLSPRLPHGLTCPPKTGPAKVSVLS